MSETSTLIAYDSKITREELARVPTPPATATHQPIPHHQIVEALLESLIFRANRRDSGGIRRFKRWHEDVRSARFGSAPNFRMSIRHRYPKLPRQEYEARLDRRRQGSSLYEHGVSR